MIAELPRSLPAGLPSGLSFLNLWKDLLTKDISLDMEKLRKVLTYRAIPLVSDPIHSYISKEAGRVINHQKNNR